MSGIVYHYTDTLRLPWIIQSGELRPGRNAFGGFPDPDFLWASTMPIPDGTAAYASKQGLAILREGLTRSVRLSLRVEDFLPWPEIVSEFPAWTPQEVRRLERAANGKSNPKHWMCRADALPLESWQSVETRSLADANWSPLDINRSLIVIDPNTLGTNIAGKVYVAERMLVDAEAGIFGYSPLGSMPLQEMMRFAA